MKCKPLLLVCLAAGAVCSRQEVPVQPNSILPQELPRLIQSLPEYAHFAFSGVSFFGGRLYATSTLGLLVVAGGEPEALYQWQERDAVVQGPWRDLANDTIWTSMPRTGRLRALTEPSGNGLSCRVQRQDTRGVIC